MMALYRVIDGQAVLWTGEPIWNVRHPRSIETRWSDAELEAIGLYRVPPAEVPEGQEIVSDSVEVIAGRPERVTSLAPVEITPEDVDAERDRRLGPDATFVFEGATFQFGPESRENIMGAANLAAIALTLDGKAPDDLYWHDGADPFVFLDAANTPVAMDAATVIAFGKAAAERKTAMIFAARALKEMTPIPADYTADSWWP